MNRDFKGIWIPKEIYLAKDLNWTEKILLVEIDSLDNEQGCFANNEYFSNFLGISKGRISKNISLLTEKGYITSEIIYKVNSKEIEKRVLHTTIRYGRKHLEGTVANDNTPIGVNDQDNNTIINNTINNKKEKEKGIDILIKNYTENTELKECIRDFIKMRAAIKKPVTDRALKILLDKLDRLESTEDKKIKVLEQSIMNSWLGIFPLKEEVNEHVKCTSDKYDPFDI